MTASSDFDAEALLEELLTPADAEAGELWAVWKWRTLRHAYQERQPLRYVVDGLLPCPSLSIVYGGPGSLKSMLLADLCICVAAGSRWLDMMPGTGVKPGVTFATIQGPVLWLDFDNGIRRTDERFDAIGKAHQQPESIPLTYVSMPTPWFDASNRAMVETLAKAIKRLGAQLVVIDNLGVVSGNVEENSGEMANVMGNLRWLCEETEAAVIVVHHQRKSSVNGDKGIRKGETLRGHSSIEAALDLALLVERKEGEDAIAVIPTKVRGFREHDIFGAYFAYEHKPGTKDLAAARFFSKAVYSSHDLLNEAIRETVKLLLRELRQPIQKTLIDAVRDHLAAKPGGKAPGINKVRGLLKEMVKDGEIVTEGNGSQRTYSLY